MPSKRNDLSCPDTSAVARYAQKPRTRRLRGYGLDPSLGEQLITAGINEVAFQVPWEDLRPGPTGEYLEVIDYDPPSRAFYHPVDLEHVNVVAQDGLAPSEGTPQFHQQMVYAVAMITIKNFEHALGRITLWSPGPPPRGANEKDDSTFVQRLRVYPHALRDANAYYSPDKKALLFGYFTATIDDPADHVPGGLVFSCLSHDIIAHETTHALLDGLHTGLDAATNPYMLAFHEAFADIVALFQHFTFKDILRHQIAKTRGDIRSRENTMAQLASQFGRAIGYRGALRDSIGHYDKERRAWVPHEPDPREYESTLEPHDRGAILVAAIFDAFTSIYASRTEDLVRLYTGGSGVLPGGSIHPDLVERLSAEAAKAAQHVLTMCVRALDYCPPVDLTFGEYLRALITADLDLVHDDQLHYRVAFIEAFKRRGLYPRDVKTLSVESLRWRPTESEESQPSEELITWLRTLRSDAGMQRYAGSREQLFTMKRNLRKNIHEYLAPHFESSVGRSDAVLMGIDPDQGFEVHAAHFALRSGPDGNVLSQLIIQINQSRTVPRRRGGGMRMEGGCVIVADLDEPRVAYCIRKPVTSVTRQARQDAFLETDQGESLRRTYPTRLREPFALIHRIAFKRGSNV